MPKWVDVPLNRKLFKNLDEEMLTATYAALENCFVTESSGVSKFPGLKLFADLPNESDIHLGRYGNDLIAVGEDGRSFRIDSNGDHEEIPGTPVAGGERVSFARTRDGLMMAAGAQIIKYDGTENSILSNDAPLSSFVGFLDGYVMAVEKDSGRFQHTALNDFEDWNPLNTFAVDGSPDDITAMIVTPFNEIIFAGEESLEQYERNLGNSDVPFFNRWAVGDGISEPHTLCFAGNAVWGLNDQYEFVRLTGQTTQPVSNDIQYEIEHRYSLDNLSALNRAWASECYIKGQKFIIFQSPEATNTYGTKGLTGVLDMRRGHWFEIFGWDECNGVPDLWQGRSVFPLWGKTLIGGQGKVYQLDPETYTNDGEVQRAYIRTAHFDSAGTIRVDGVRFTIKRGVGTYEKSPAIVFRTNVDNRGWNNWQKRELGKIGQDTLLIEFGAQGIGDTFQFEIYMTDDAPFELRRMQLDSKRALR